MNVSIKQFSQRGLLQFGIVQKSTNINGHDKIHLILLIFPSAGQRKERTSLAFPSLSQASLNKADDPRRSQKDVYNCACQLIFQCTFHLRLVSSLSAKFCMHIQNLIVKPAKVYVNPWNNYNDLKAWLILKPKLTVKFVALSNTCITIKPKQKKTPEPNNQKNPPPSPFKKEDGNPCSENNLYFLCSNRKYLLRKQKHIDPTYERWQTCFTCLTVVTWGEL